jgi:tetratricopeptide (TPR) repeat protein
VSTLAQRNARTALDAVRATVARLDPSTGAEDLAADLIDIWGAVEAALRTLVGGGSLSGQALIREARQRQMISFDLANALAEFQAVFDRVHDTSYKPNASDISAARNAFDKLDTALSADPVADSPRVAPTDPFAPGSAASATTPAGVLPSAVPPPRRFPVWMLALAGVVVLALVLGGAYFVFGHRGSDTLQQGIDAYRRGQREVAVNAFNKAAKEDTHAALPHIYLARMARDVGNFTLSSQELQLALQAEPESAIALREMGANLLTQGNYELARRFYVRAAQADPTDKIALGYLGCTLIRLNRSVEGTSFLNRAGPGPWSNCTPTVPPTAAGVIPR